MNDPSKRIDVNLSSLLSLKAELLRKHEEVNKAKSSHYISNFVPQRSASTKSKSAKKHDKSGTRTEEIDNAQEDIELLKKSRRVLEAKSQFYDKMCRSGGKLNSDDNSLVMFNQKRQNTKSGLARSRYSSSDEYDDRDDQPSSEHGSGAEDGEWVEYTDCLGRTRKCLKEDLETFKKKDKELAGARSVSVAPEPFISPSLPKWYEDTKGEPDDRSVRLDNDDNDDTLSMISKASKIDEMRSNWDKQEMENANKESIHYQNVLFDEARTHGVGYYAFSTDETERAKQQQELETTREKTLDAQHLRDEQRKAREKIIAERVRAAKNRQRARAGLPPLEDNPEPEVPAAPPISAADKKRLAKEAKRAKQKEQEAVQRAAERKQHVRPWDKGKDKLKKNKCGDRSSDEDDDDDDEDDEDDEWQYKPEKEPMSQEKWNEMQRAERKDEFKPSYHKATNPFKRPQPFVAQTIVNEVSDHEDISYDIQPPPATAFNSSAHEFQARSSSNPSKQQSFGSQANRKPFVRRHVAHEQSDDNDDEHDVDDEVDYDIAPPGTTDSRNPEFAPPPTFEYYGPSASKQRRPVAIKPGQLESSIEAGLRFLREQSDKDTASTKMKWASNAGY